MAWDGFLPKGIVCTRCGKELQGSGSGRPAESYMGTYTGLCYPCTNAGGFKVETFQYVSGAWEWNHPPQCPSYRRDRERVLAFDDCEKCRGKGWVSRKTYDPFRGSISVQCPTCMDRHTAHPIIAKIERLRKIHNVKFCLLQKVALRLWKEQMEAAGYPTEPEDKAEHVNAAAWSPRQNDVAAKVRKLLPRSLADGEGPIQWPEGVYPLRQETKETRKLYSGQHSAGALTDEEVCALAPDVKRPRKGKKATV